MTRITLTTSAVDDAADVLALRQSVAQDLTRRYGKGPWSGSGTIKGVLFDMRRSTVFLARARNRAVATLSLSARKPWAIDRKYFAESKRPLYLTSMAVCPELQRNGIGRLCIVEARIAAQRWPSDAIRLDAFDADAGAGDFYRKCGFTEVGRASYRGTPLIYFELFV